MNQSSQRLPATLISAMLVSTCGLLFSHLANAEPTRAILLNAVQGEITYQKPQAVKLLITQGQAKGCLAYGTAYLNKKRLRYEFNLQPIKCIKNGHAISVGTVVRGQHNIKGTMANSGMGRNYLISNKGVTVTLAEH